MLDNSVILNKLKEKYTSLVEKYGENRILGTFVIGNANYSFAETEDDLIFYSIYLPSFEELCMRNEEQILDKYIYDIRDLYSITIKDETSCCALEMLFTQYSIITPKYEKIFKEYLINNREIIAHYNIKKRVGIMLSKIQTALKENNDFKVAILYNAVTAYANNENAEESFKISNPMILEYLKAVKSGTLSIDKESIIKKTSELYQEASEESNFKATSLIKEGIVALVTDSLQESVPIESFIATLTKTEEQAFEVIQTKLQGGRGIISISKLIEETGISRPVFKNLLNKMEVDKIAEIRNQGVNGTLIEMR